MTRTQAMPALAMAAAFWPVWIWFGKGLADSSNDYSGVLALATMALVLARRGPVQAVPAPLMLPALMTALYIAATALNAPSAVCGAVALLAFGNWASAILTGQRCNAPLLLLCLLALPVAATLQFYLGYPLRVLAGVITAAMLGSNGIGVLREGATLVWDGRVIAIDAPCSGVRMLWMGLYLACALAALARMGWPRTIAAAICAIGVVVIANAVRAAALFYVESGIIVLPPWAHGAIGLGCFAAAALAIVWTTRRLVGAPA